MILLTDEEIRRAIDELPEEDFDNLTDVEAERYKDRTIAKAQLKKAEPLIRQDEREKVYEEIDDMIIGTTALFEKRMTEGCLCLDINPVQWQELTGIKQFGVDKATVGKEEGI